MNVTYDAVLGGRLRIWQPAAGFRAGSDAVLLAAACPARPGDSLLDLGCGVGTAMLCVAARVPGTIVTGVERHAPTAALARRNAGNDAVVEADVLALPGTLRARGFDHVILNPPYLSVGSGPDAADRGRADARREGGAGDLVAWCDVACRRAGPTGTVAAIARADRLADLLTALAPRLGAIVILPIAPSPNAAARRVIVRGRKDARAPLRLLAPLVTHDVDGRTPEYEAVLREAAPLAIN